MLPWNPPSAFSLAGGNNHHNAGNSSQREGAGGGFSPYADGQMTQQQHQQQTQQLHQQQQQQQQQQGGGGQGQQQQQPGPQNGGGPPANQNQAYPPMTLASTLHFLQSEHRRYARDRNEWEIERAEMRARIALLEGEKRGNEGALKSLARRCKMLEMALRGERSKFLTSSMAAGGGGTGGLGTGHAAASSAAVSVGGGASPAMSGTASPVPGGALSLASALGTAGASIPPNKLVALQTLTASPVSTPGDAPKSIPMATSTSSPGQAAGIQNPPSSVPASGTGRSDSVSSGSGPSAAAAGANGFQSGTWASTAASASGHSAAHGAGGTLGGAGGLRDPRGKARSREYLKQCLQEITYLTSSATLNPLAAHSYAAPGVPRPRKVLPDQVPATNAPGVLNLGGGGGAATAAAATATTSAAAASTMVSAPASSAATTTLATEAAPAPVSGSAHPGAEFEPVAASSIATATPVGFPPVSTTVASSSGSDVFESVPMPTPISNGVTSEIKPVEEGESEREAQIPSITAAAEDVEEEDDDEDRADHSGASDPPSAFVPLKRQVSRPSGNKRDSNRAKKSAATDSSKSAPTVDDADDLDKAIAELSLPSEREAPTKSEGKPAETDASAASSATAQEDSTIKEAQESQGEAESTEEAKEEVPTVEPEASEVPGEESETAAETVEVAAPSKEENGIKSDETESSKGDENVGDLGTISRGRGGRAGVASLFGGLESDGGRQGRGEDSGRGQSGMSSLSSLPTSAEKSSVDSAASEDEEIPTALFRPDEGWKEKLAAAGRRAYRRAVAGGDAELEALAWDLDGVEAQPKDMKADDVVGPELREASPRFKPGRVLRSHLDAVRVVKVVAVPAAANGASVVEAVSGSDDCTVKVWRDLTDETKRRGELEPVATYRGHAGPITALAVTYSETIGLKVILSGSLDSTVCIWRYPDAGRTTYDPVDESVLLGTIETHGDAVWGIEPLRNDRFACITADGSIQVWDWSTSTLERSWQYRASMPNLRGSLSKKPPSVQVPTAMALLTAQGGVEQLVVAFQNGAINLYDPDISERELKTLVSCDSADGTPECQINSLAVDRAKSLLFVGSEDRSISIFSLTDGSRLCSFTAHLDGVTSLASLSPDIFASASHDTSIRIWSLARGTSDTADSASATCIQDLQAHRTKGAEGVLDVATPATLPAPMLVSAGADGTLRVWCSA